MLKVFIFVLMFLLCTRFDILIKSAQQKTNDLAVSNGKKIHKAIQSI